MSNFNTDLLTSSFIDDDHIEEVVRAANQVVLDVGGDSFADGHSFANIIIHKLTIGESLTHAPIIFGEKYKNPDTRELDIRAEDTPFNRGMLFGFDLDDVFEPSDITTATKIEINIGKKTLAAHMEPIWVPEDDLTPVEKDGLKRHLFGNDGINSPGITVLPKVALRAVLV